MTRVLLGLQETLCVECGLAAVFVAALLVKLLVLIPPSGTKAPARENRAKRAAITPRLCAIVETGKDEDEKINRATASCKNRIGGAKVGTAW